MDNIINGIKILKNVKHNEKSLKIAINVDDEDIYNNLILHGNKILLDEDDNIISDNYNLTFMTDDDIEHNFKQCEVLQGNSLPDSALYNAGEFFILNKLSDVDDICAGGLLFDDSYLTFNEPELGEIPNDIIKLQWKNNKLIIYLAKDFNKRVFDYEISITNEDLNIVDEKLNFSNGLFNDELDTITFYFNKPISNDLKYKIVYYISNGRTRYVLYNNNWIELDFNDLSIDYDTDLTVLEERTISKIYDIDDYIYEKQDLFSSQVKKEIKVNIMMDNEKYIDVEYISNYKPLSEIYLDGKLLFSSKYIINNNRITFESEISGNIIIDIYHEGYNFKDVKRNYTNEI